MPATRLTRRRFLGTTARSAAILGIPTVLTRRAWGRGSPNDLLQLGCIGTGREGRADMAQCLESGLNPAVHARVVAVCDVDRRRVEQAREAANAFYTQRLTDGSRPRIDVYGDFRELLARDDIDGVIVATPDHWHGLVAVAAAAAGKDIYLQKPLTYTIVEGQRLVEAVRRQGVVLQTGSQQRSSASFRRACELVRNGRLGRLRSIQVTLPVDQGHGDPTPCPVPEHLDYDLWLGPASAAPYAEARVHPHAGFDRPGWLQIEAYCRGMITGWGSHMFDIAQWGHGSDDTGPVEMRATAEFPQRGLFDVHTRFRAEGCYADGVQLTAESGTPAGVRFQGDDRWIDVGREHLTAEPEDVLATPVEAGETRLPVSSNHMLNFLQCLRTRQDPLCPVEVGHRSNTICVITHLAMKLGRTLRWDPAAERFLDDEAANALLDYTRRPPWSL